ncbi:MAG: DUF5615 family PIN-like protein [Ferruginibacter sp.]
MQPEELVFWIDMNLPASLAAWINDEFGITAKTFAELGLQTAPDLDVFKKAVLDPSVVVITTKDYDFVEISNESKGKPRILYLNIGNVNNKVLRQIFDTHFKTAIQLLTQSNQPLVEITK